MYECPDCGATVADGHGICPTCGAKLRAETQPCGHCGEIIALGAEACPACGHFAVPGVCAVHPERDAPGRCALCGIPVCSECDAGERFHRCGDHGDVSVVEGWAQVLTVPDEVQARLIEDNLKAEGIDSRTLSKKDHFTIPVEFGDLARVRILVPTYAFQEAEAVLEGHREGGGDVAFGCPECGQPYEEGQTVCPACGHALA